MESLLFFVTLSIGLNILMFIPAFIFKTDKLTDISYALTFIIIALTSFWSGTYDIKKVILLILVLLWAFRLGLYLFQRIHKIKKDDRFDTFRERFLSFLGFWLLQGLTVFLLSVPVIIFMATKNLEPTYEFSYGAVIMLIGLLFESIADQQKSKFKADPKNKNRWIDNGLWKYIRHPNYTGEILVWVGVYLYVLPYLSLENSFLAFVSPVFIILLLRYISGIPLLEQRYLEKFKGNTAYKDYVERTGRFLPKPNKIFKK